MYYSYCFKIFSCVRKNEKPNSYLIMLSNYFLLKSIFYRLKRRKIKKKVSCTLAFKIQGTATVEYKNC